MSSAHIVVIASTPLAYVRVTIGICCSHAIGSMADFAKYLQTAGCETGRYRD